MQEAAPKPSGMRSILSSGPKIFHGSGGSEPGRIDLAAMYRQSGQAASMNEAIDKVANAAGEMMAAGIDMAMSKYNGKGNAEAAGNK